MRSRSLKNGGVDMKVHGYVIVLAAMVSATGATRARR